MIYIYIYIYVMYHISYMSCIIYMIFIIYDTYITCIIYIHVIYIQDIFKRYKKLVSVDVYFAPIPTVGHSCSPLFLNFQCLLKINIFCLPP